MSRNCLSPWLVDVSESSLPVARRRLPVARRRLPWVSSTAKERCLSLWIYWNRKVQLLVAVAVVDGTLCRWLSSTAIELSLMGFPDSLR
ncbi:unnamed protein product [Brassica rapa subsp. narinosa]